METEIQNIYNEVYTTESKQKPNIHYAYTPSTFQQVDIGKPWRDKINNDPNVIEEQFHQPLANTKTTYTPQTFYSNRFLDQHVLKKIDEDNINNFEKFQKEKELREKLNNKIKLLQQKRK